MIIYNKDTSNPDNIEIMDHAKKPLSSHAVLGEVPSCSVCEICKKGINNITGNPGLWGVGLPYPHGYGKKKYYHQDCLAELVARHFA